MSRSSFVLRFRSERHVVVADGFAGVRPMEWGVGARPRADERRMNAAPARTTVGIGTRIMLIAVCPVIVALAATVFALLGQQQRLASEIDGTIRQQSNNEAAKVAQSVYLLCAGSEQRNQRQLTHDLAVARDRLAHAGEISFTDERVAWRAVNQFTQDAQTIELPKMQIGSEWLGQVSGAEQPAGLVDDVSKLTGDFCTLFQRMNDAGDMLRVSTSVLKASGERAIGTYIPAKNPDGSDNVVVKTVLGGESYRGRAFVVSQWQATAYEPIWDAAKKRVVGMLYVGVGLNEMNREIRDVIARMTVGKTGYVYVLGGTGDQRGRYLLSQGGKRDGENIWDARDADGRLFIQSIVGKAVRMKDGAVEFETYPWQNPGEDAPRMKFAAVTYFAPWDWVIGASGYEDEFAAVREQVEAAQRRMLGWVVAVAGVIALVGTGAGGLFSRRIAKPIVRVISDLNESSSQINAAAGETATASQSLAQGSSEQASSLEEISASLEEMSGVTRRNAENATKANEIARDARQAADAGATDMQAMSAAMADIKRSSDDIAKIIKTIDEIAFQTNILALNAAVEAARAGESGMGFAVVAEEVRSLAQRSAQAARETAEKIEGAIGKTSQGVQISGRVAGSLAEIVEKVRQVDGLVAEVATASREQSQGVEQINNGVREMDRVVQTNAAAAEESAGAAEELNGQAANLREAVEALQRLVGGRSGEAARSREERAKEEPERPAGARRSGDLPVAGKATHSPRRVGTGCT